MLVCIRATSDPQDLAHADNISELLNLPLCLSEHDVQAYRYILQLNQGVLSLKDSTQAKSSPICVDFSSSALSHRRKFGGGEAILQAVKGRSKDIETIYDATAGLGVDASIMANAGFHVTLTERHPILAVLLENGITRALSDADQNVVKLAQNMQFLKGDSLQVLQSTTAAWDVVYLDPMFPHREKTALVKHAMRVFRELVGQDSDADQLLALALLRARKRVVVKRPRLAPTIDSRKPSYSLKGKANRFDVYIVNR